MAEVKCHGATVPHSRGAEVHQMQSAQRCAPAWPAPTRARQSASRRLGPPRSTRRRQTRRRSSPPRTTRAWRSSAAALAPARLRRGRTKTVRCRVHRRPAAVQSRRCCHRHCPERCRLPRARASSVRDPTVGALCSRRSGFWRVRPAVRAGPGVGVGDSEGANKRTCLPEYRIPTLLTLSVHHLTNQHCDRSWA